MKDILSEIIANKRFEVDLQKQAISIEQLQEGISEMPSSRSMKQALISSSPGIIAEFKRRSSLMWKTLFGWPDNFPKMQYWYPKAESPTRKL